MLRGKNSALAGRFFLELLLQTSAHPFAPFFYNFQFNLSQGAASIAIRAHWFFGLV
jgi:hypothetical protein